MLLSLILSLSAYYVIIIYRLSDDVKKKNLKRKPIVSIENYKQSHFPSEISSPFWTFGLKLLK